MRYLVVDGILRVICHWDALPCGPNSLCSKIQKKLQLGKVRVKGPLCDRQPLIPKILSQMLRFYKGVRGCFTKKRTFDKTRKNNVKLGYKGKIWAENNKSKRWNFSTWIFWKKKKRQQLKTSLLNFIIYQGIIVVYVVVLSCCCERLQHMNRSLNQGSSPSGLYVHWSAVASIQLDRPALKRNSGPADRHWNQPIGHFVYIRTYIMWLFCIRGRFYRNCFKV